MSSQAAPTPGLTGEYANSYQGGVTGGPWLAGTWIPDHRVTQIDQNVSFSWTSANPPAGGAVSLSTYFVRWTGYITFPSSGTVDLLGLNASVVIGNSAIPGPPVGVSSVITPTDTTWSYRFTNVQSAIAYPITIVAQRHSTVKLSWSYSGQALDVIPVTAFVAAVAPKSPSGVNVTNAPNNALNINFSPVASSPSTSGYVAYAGEGSVNYITPVNTTPSPVAGPYVILDANLGSYQLDAFTVKALYLNPVTGDYTQSSPATVGTAVTPQINPINIVPNPPLGFLPNPMTLVDWMKSVEPVDSSEAQNGPSGAISVNMEYGVAVVDSGPDLVVGNAVGPDISFERIYRTAMAAGNLSSPGLPPGWTHNWDYQIVPTTSGTWGPLALVYPSGAWDTLTPVISGGMPTGAFRTSLGAPYIVTGTPSSTIGIWTTVTISQNGLSREVFWALSGDTVYRLQQKFFSNGSQVDLNYNSSFQLTSIDNGSGGITLLTLTYSPLLTTVSGPSTTSIPNNSRTYYYTNGELSSVTMIGGTPYEWTYHYTPRGTTNQPYLDIATTVDPQNTASPTTITYSPATGRVSSYTDLTGNVRTLAYPINSGTVTVTNPQKSVTDSFTLGIDANGRLGTFKTAAGDLTSVLYSNSYPTLPVIVTPPLGNGVMVTPDYNGNPAQVKCPFGNSTYYSWIYPPCAPLGLLSSVSEVGTDGTTMGTTSYSYYLATGNGGILGYLQSVTYPNGNTVSYTYTAMGDVLTVSDVTGTMTFGYTDGLNTEIYGRPYSVMDQMSNITKFQYDDSGRLNGTTDPTAVSSSQTLDQYGQITSLNLPLGLSVTPTYAFDGKPPVSMQVSQNGDHRSSSSIFDSQSQLAVLTDPNGLTNTQALDGESNLIGFVNGNGNQMHQFTYSPAMRSIVTHFGTALSTSSLSITSTLNPSGNLVNAAGSDGRNLTQTYLSSDPDLLNTIVATDHGTGWTSQINANQYDVFGRLTDIECVAPDGASKIRHTYTYDGEGNVLTDTTSPVLYSSGLLGTGQQGPTNITYVYNPDGTRHQMVVGLNLVGSVAGAPASVTYNYSYDFAKRIASITVYGSSGTTAVSTGTALAYANYFYDANGRVQAVRSLKATTFYGYNALGQVTQVQNVSPDGNPDTHAPTAYHVPDPYLKGPDHVTPLDHTILACFTNIGYNVLGNRTGMSFVLASKQGTVSDPTCYFSSGSTRWNYDAGGRLTGETWSRTGGGASTTYTHNYDGGGNLSTLRGYSQSLDPTSDQLRSTAGTWENSIVYNSSGDLTQFNAPSSLSYSAAYNPLGQMASISSNRPGLDGTIITYSASTVYDHLGRRAALTESLVDGATTSDVQFFVYDGDYLIYRQISSTTPTKQDWSDLMGSDAILYLHGPTGLAMEFSPYGLSRTLLFDPQGSFVVATLLGTSGGYVDLYGFLDWVLFDSYGLPALASFNADTYAGVYALDNATAQPIQYKGQYGCYTDGVNGLVYCLNRYYDPQIGRWLSRDPSGLGGGVNVYAYCDGDPVMGADPTGLVDDDSYWHYMKEVFIGEGQAVTGVFTGAYAYAKGLKEGGWTDPLYGIKAAATGIWGLWEDMKSAWDGDARAAGRLVGNLDLAILAEGAGRLGRVTGPSGKSCFVAGTRIRLHDGSSKPIEEIKSGDRVLTRSELSDQNGKTESERVSDVYSYHHNGILHLRFASGGTLEVTPEHPLFVISKGFTPAESLRIGDCIAEIDSLASDRLISIITKPGDHVVYNLNVSEDHSYFVRTSDGTWLWVHNQCSYIHPKSGVPIIDGFPDFGEHAIADLTIEPTWNRPRDFRAADRIRGLPREKGHTWHHHQDYGRMQLVPTEVHFRTGHKGGFHLWPYLKGK